MVTARVAVIIFNLAKALYRGCLLEESCGVSESHDRLATEGNETLVLGFWNQVLFLKLPCLSGCRCFKSCLLHLLLELRLRGHSRATSTNELAMYRSNKALPSFLHGLVGHEGESHLLNWPLLISGAGCGSEGWRRLRNELILCGSFDGGDVPDSLHLGGWEDGGVTEFFSRRVKEGLIKRVSEENDRFLLAIMIRLLVGILRPASNELRALFFCQRWSSHVFHEL